MLPIKRKSIKERENEKIKFLSDTPLESSQFKEDKFGHGGVAETIKNTILNCPTPFTIGLFGKWGVGKTTIINMVMEKLENEKIPVVNFDVWKHEGDSLRRTFLKEVVKQLIEIKHLPKNFELSERLDRRVSRTTQNRFILNSKYLGLFMIVLVVASIVFYYFFPQFFGIYLSFIIGGSFVSYIIVWIFQQLLTTEAMTYSEDRFKDLHEFESEFRRIIDKINVERLVMVIDNLDRTSHKKAVEVLSTIKTFLEQKKCIFLIACDDKAIKKHLESIYPKSLKEENKQFVDEFLRKFFNAFLRIPDFIDMELHEYVEKMLKETRVKKLDDKEVAHVIYTAFRDNPRQIKQFINTLLSHYLLAKDRENKPNPLIKQKGTITNNIGFLAKLLVIEQKSDEAWRKIKKEKLNSDEINKLEISEVVEFLKSTKLIPRGKIENVRPFIYLKQSELELKIQGEADLEIALLKNDEDFVIKKLKDAKSEELLKEYEKFIVNLVEVNRSRIDSLFNIVSSSLKALKSNYLNFPTGEYYNKVADLLGNELKDQLYMFNPSLIFEQIFDHCDTRLRHRIRNQYVEILKSQGLEKKTYEISDEWASELFQEILKHIHLFEKKKNEISKALSDAYYSNIKIMSVFKNKPKAQKDFISEEVLRKFILTLSKDDINNKESFSDKINLILKFKGISNKNIAKEIIDKFTDLLGNENQEPFREEKENLLNNIEVILVNYQKHITEIDDKNTLITFRDAIIGGINALQDWNQKKIFIPTCIKLKSVLPDETKDSINTQIISFWGHTDPEGFEFVLNKLKENEKQKVIAEYLDNFKNRSIQNEEIFNSIWPFLKNENKLSIFKHVINSNNYKWALNKLIESNYKLDIDKKEVVSILLDRVKEVDVLIKPQFYKEINILKCGKDAKLKEELAEQIKGLLKNNDPAHQKVGYDTLNEASYLPKNLKKEIAQEIINWLKEVGPVSHTNQHSIKSVSLNLEILQKTAKKKYHDMIFEKLLTSTDIIDIKLGKDIILQTKTKYRENKSHFDGLRTRIKSEEDEGIKTELKNMISKARRTKV